MAAAATCSNTAATTPATSDSASDADAEATSPTIAGWTASGAPNTNTSSLGTSRYYRYR